MEGQSDSIVLEEEIDPNYEPTEKEVLEYATWLGMDLEAERDLFWIAREGLKAPLPENWKPCKTTDTEEIYYFNFATGQSTWDHPCDEFYRNLYEEHKKKRQTNDVQETDEKKKKVKEDVAELLGRKGSGKKKKGSLSKAEPLGGPSMGKVNPLEKKPLPGLSGRLGSLGSSGLGGAGLKPVAGLGPLKSDAKEHGGSGIGLDCATNDFKSDDLSKPLSRTLLGTVLGKKPLLSSPSVTTGDRDTAANFEDKRDQLSQDHAEKLREIQDAHDSEVETLRKKLKAQLEDVQDAEEMKLKQLRREFDKKKNDLENQFDREENTLQRSRKEQLKRLETETENIFSRKKQDLDREFKSETDNLRLKHDEKQRKIQEEFEREDEKLTEKMKSLFGDKKEAVQLATELKSEVDRLQSHQKSLEQEVSTIRSEKETLAREMGVVEQERDNAQRDAEELRRQLSEVSHSQSTAAHEECTECSVLENSLAALKAECAAAKTEAGGMREELDRLKIESEAGATAEQEKNDAAIAFSNQEAVLKQEITTLQRQLAVLDAESSDLRTRSNTQLQEHLAKEVNEKKALREQLDAKAEEISERLAGASDKHQQQVLSLQQQLENESRVRREREDACDSLRKEINALEQAKRKVDAELGQLESDKRHLESEKSMLALRLDEINTSRKREEKSVVSAEEALADKKLEAEQLRANLKVVESDREHLEARIKTLHQDFEQLLAKTHRLEAENEGERVRCRTIEKERDSASQRQQSLVDELENSQRKSRTLTAELSELQSQLSKARANEQAVTSKADQITHKMRQLEQQKERDDFAMKMKFQQAEVEHESILHAKDRAEMQLQAKEKELAAAKDEVTRKETEIESLQARIKSLLSDKEEVQAALLNANMANVASASANRESAKSISASNDVMLVKLQLADTNRNELELHLADISSQLEISTRRCASLEARCRDQSIEIESLHVEVASLRSASQKMHVSALESLALVERLEYEHKKRTLRSDFLNQLRDFQEREEQALVRHKARLRAQYERHLEDLVAELEKVRQQRVEQEEALSAQMVQQIRQERDVKRSDAKRRVREELTQFEQDLHERKARDIEIISRAIEKEENELGARLREVRQVSREKELAKDLESPGNKGKTDISHDRSAFASPGQLLKKISVRRNQPESLDDDDAEDYVTGKRSRTSDPMYDSKRSSRHQVKSMKTYQKWRQRLQEEMDLLVNARTLVANQRQGLTKQAHQLKASKKEWKRNSRLSEENPIQREVKRMLDENMANWSEGMRKLRKQESWVKQREQKLAKMKRTVEQLKRRRRAERSNNLSGSETGSDCDDDDETRTDWSDDSGQSELASTLEKLERLEEELASDAGSFSGALPLGVSDRFRSSGFDAVYHVPPPSYALQREAPYRYPLASPSGFFASRRAAYAAGDLAGQDMRWLRSQRTAFGLRGDRFAVAPAPGSGSRAEQVYQQKISRWAKGREKVQHAATTHATWLSGLCEELKEYGAKYTRVEGDYAGSDGGGQLTQEEGD
ncbi:WW domain [Phytophthora cinnamomi]|uniref:WW domain n=1 Tax=Phytophthora cinnamomi TaxID=4785 RepID=UPI00355A13DF|nr:WW domain [Phytophthora cinnamomi]